MLYVSKCWVIMRKTCQKASETEKRLFRWMSALSSNMLKHRIQNVYISKNLEVASIEREMKRVNWEDQACAPNTSKRASDRIVADETKGLSIDT